MLQARCILWFCALSTFLKLALAEAGPPTIAGGTIDMSLTAIGDVYTDRPQAASATGACKGVQTYVDFIQAGRYGEIVDLFTADAILMEPSRGSPRVGSAAISAFFQGPIAAMKADIVPVAYVGAGRDCFVELAVRMTVNGQHRYVLTSVDHFTTDRSGKFIRMVAFSRPLGPGAVVTR